MKKLVAIVLCFLLVLTQVFTFALAEEVTSADTRILAFPSAEGAGAYTSGGRGGSVYEVTNLNDSGAGSFRDAVSQPNRTIVFRLSGTIKLKSAIKILADNLTIAGQTAPGDGITISGYPVLIQSDNVIIRYMRFRLGDQNGLDSDSLDINFANNVIADHISASWAVDENFSVYDNVNVTVQWSIISEALNNINHSCGGLWGGGGSYHHNLFAHNKTRNAKLAYLENSDTAGPDITDFRNNIIYDWGEMSTYTGSQGSLNIVNNYYKPGPSTKSSVMTTIVEPDGSGTNKMYVSGNYMYGSTEVTADNWKGVTGPAVKFDTPFAVAPVTTYSAEEAYNVVLAESGASLHRDAVDTRVVNDVINGTGSIIYSQNDVGGYPELKSANLPQDTDHDGMPDEWELANGLNPNDPEDRNGDFNGDGYTNLEKYLNSLTPNGQYKPIVYYHGPAANTIYDAPANIEVAADVYDVDGTISKVELYNGSTLLGTDTAAPYSFILENAADGTYNLSVKAYDNSGLTTSTNPAPIYVNTVDNTLPWISEDIGSVGIPGSASDADGILTVKGSGEIGGNSDSFHYLFQKLNGNGEIIAKVDADTPLGTGADAGIMIRNELTLDSAAVMLAVSYGENSAAEPQRIITFNTRADKGASMTSSVFEASSLPLWLKISREGNIITAYFSADGVTWTQTESQTVVMNDDVYIGFASGAGEKTSGILSYNTVRFSNVKITGIIPPVIFMNQANAITNNPNFTISGNANKRCKVATIINGAEVSRKMIGYDLNYTDNVKLIEGRNEITAQAYLTQVVVNGIVVAEVPSDAKLKLNTPGASVKNGNNKVILEDENTGETIDVDINVADNSAADSQFPVEIRRITSEQSITVILDTIPPVLQPDQGDVTVNKSAFILSGSVSENCNVIVTLNGQEPVNADVDENLRYSFGLNLELGTNNVTIKAVDPAENVSETKNIVITLVDNTPPEVIYPTNILQHGTYVVDVADDLSGVKECIIKINGKTYNSSEIENVILPLGSYNVNIIASDVAGNVTDINYVLKVDVYVDTLGKVISKARTLNLVSSDEVRDILIGKVNTVLCSRYRVNEATAALEVLRGEVGAQSQYLSIDFIAVLLDDISYLKGLYADGKLWDAVYSKNLKFDFGSGNLAAGYTKVITSTLYTPILGYGLVGESFDGRSRKGPDDLRRDFVFSNYKNADGKWQYQFWVDLPNGNYTVSFISGDRDADQAAFKVNAEGELKLEGISSAKGSFSVNAFNVAITDGQLNIEFLGSNIVRINALEIIPQP